MKLSLIDRFTESKYTALAITFGAALTVWLLDAAYDTVLTSGSTLTFWQSALTQVPLHDVYQRTVIILGVLVWGYVMSRFLRSSRPNL